MFDLKITDLSKTEEEGNVDFIALTNEQWAIIKANIELLKNHEKCELMYAEDFKKSIDKAREDAIDEFVQKYKSETEECDIGYDCYNCCYHSCTEGAKHKEVEEIAQQLKEQDKCLEQ